MRAGNGTLIRVLAVDPATLADDPRKPAKMICGLLEIQVKVNRPGDTATVTVFPPGPGAGRVQLVQVSAAKGWLDYSAYASFNVVAFFNSRTPDMPT
ncbi:MAG: hypothetical protein HY712_07005 [candidate division NC10 bacterium]|nr:hypothetical protein [candidate division NC10 bacterium]